MDINSRIVESIPNQNLKEAFVRFAKRHVTEEPMEIYLAPNIPDKKLKKATSSMEIPETQEILVLVDNTILGSAKYGICVTKDSVYWRCRFDEPGNVKFNDVESFDLSLSSDTPPVVINGQEISLSIPKDEIQLFADLLLAVLGQEKLKPENTEKEGPRKDPEEIGRREPEVFESWDAKEPKIQTCEYQVFLAAGVGDDGGDVGLFEDNNIEFKKDWKLPEALQQFGQEGWELVKVSHKFGMTDPSWFFLKKTGQKWEYRMLTVDDDIGKKDFAGIVKLVNGQLLQDWKEKNWKLPDALQELGKEGWQLTDILGRHASFGIIDHPPLYFLKKTASEWHYLALARTEDYDTLSELGEQGWELVNILDVYTTDSSTTLLFLQRATQKLEYQVLTVGYGEQDDGGKVKLVNDVLLQDWKKKDWRLPDALQELGGQGWELIKVLWKFRRRHSVDPLYFLRKTTQKWEYQVLTIADHISGGKVKLVNGQLLQDWEERNWRLPDALQELGKRGWELADILCRYRGIGSRYDPLYFLKRPKQISNE